MNTQEEFEAAERTWRAQLVGRSLIIEASADPLEAEEALRILGANYRRADTRDRKMKLLLRYQASFIIGVCSAAFQYDVRGMWPYLEDIFGPLPSADQQLLSNAFRTSLDNLGLSRFTFPRRNVDEILMHAGIPGQRMDEFIELLARRDALTDGLDGRTFCQWIGSVSRSTAFAAYGLDAPTYRFLAEGREIAEDLVDRCLELLDAWSQVGVTEADVGAFPGVMRSDLLRALDELTDKQISPRSRQRSRQVDLTPKLLFAPATGVSVRLPPIETITDNTVEWVISAEGSASRKTVDPPWPGDPVRTHHFPVSKPAKQVALTALPGDQTWVVNVVDPDDPLLVFDSSTGEWVPPRNTLPNSDTWIAIPNPNNLGFDDLIEIDGTATWQALEEPLGWTNWLFVAVALSSVSKLRRRESEVWRYVSSIQRPVIEEQNVLQWARALDGAPISASLPRITLPPVADRAGTVSSIEWIIAMTRTDTGEVVSELKSRSSSVAKAIDLELPDGPLVGAFNFTVKGPLGRGTSRRVTMVPGLTITPSVQFRHMSESGDGLVPASVTLRAPVDIPIPDRVVLASRERSQVVAVGGAPDFRIVVEIPAMAVTKLSGGAPITSHSPLPLDLEDLADTQLRVTFGTPGRSHLVAMRGKQLLQTVTATAAGAFGAATFNLAQLSETLAVSGGAALFVGADSVRIPIGRVRPRQLVESIVLDPDDSQKMLLIGAHTDNVLEVAFYPRYAPWLGPRIAKSTDDHVVIPPDLRGEGELRVVLRVEDPWVSYEWPSTYPSRTFNVFDLQLGELNDARGEYDQGFRSWLKRRSPCPVDPSALPLALSLYVGNDITKYRTPVMELRRDLAEAIALNREYVPAAYPQSAAGVAPIDLFVDADVVALPPAWYSHGATLWESSPLLALLANSHSLASVSDDLNRVLGESATRILNDGIDLLAAQGRFGANEELIARWPADRIETVWKSINPIPGRLLDAETRIIAAKQIFDNRWRIPFDQNEAATLVSLTQQVLHRAYGDKGNVPMQARFGSPGWASLPAYTLAFSLAARARARKVEGAGELHKRTKPYLVALASMAPKLVEQDLILAELWLTRWSTE
jgi:hypothetical protein